MKIVCISDTHGLYQPSDLPDGDVLIHAGDLSVNGQVHEIQRSLAWLRKFPHKLKLVIGGNHDASLQETPSAFKDQLKPYRDYSPLCLLNGDKTIEYQGIRFFGTPVSPAFGSTHTAFAVKRDDLAAYWRKIPLCDVLITHGPPLGILDAIVGLVHMEFNGELKVIHTVEALGDEALRDQVLRAQRSLKLHVFGHIHGGHGMKVIDKKTFVNAALLDDQYKPSFEPIVVEVTK